MAYPVVCIFSASKESEQDAEAGHSNESRMIMMVPSNIRKAVIVESSFGEATLLSFPVGKQHLIDHLLETFSDHGIEELAIITGEVSPYTAELFSRIRREGAIKKVLWEVTSFYRGTAGSLKLVQKFLEDEDQFMVVHSNLYLRGLNLRDAVKVHHHGRNGVTFVACSGMEEAEDFENIQIDQSGLIAQVSILHGSKDRRRRLRPSGVYVMGREVLDVIPSGEYFDIKEQLVPVVRRQGMPVRAHVVKGPVYAIRKSEDLLELNRRILLEGGRSPEDHDRWYTGMDCIFIGENVQISPNCYLLGPLVIGPNSVVEDNVQVIGPAVIGAATRLEKGCMVRESVVWSRTQVMSNARVEYSFIPNDIVVPEGTRLRHSHQITSGSWNTFAMPSEHGMTTLVNGTPRSWGRRAERGIQTSAAYRTVKRAMDVVFSSMFLLLSFPLFALISLAVKLDSRGPVLFSQARCGKDGREFRMLKFRTMVVDAEKSQAALRARNAVDGPMFKLDEDPRITRVGKVLRKLSLDELPQLINVLRGEMSLVGPRPLAYEEMKFCPSWRSLRLTVMPGVTGLWQVRSRDHNRFSDWIKYDTEYVQTQSLFTDLRILIRTVAVLQKGV
jgi:lipopolysaccharide/colanic/teichoic acid biosynthesis glycosyltransferase/ADP-glucose pyrophosphorylase